MSGIAAATIGAAVIGGVVSRNASNKAADANQKAIDANAYQGQIATDQYENYKDTYRPLEQQFVKDVQDDDSPEAYNRAASEAGATVNNQLGMAMDRLTRTPGFDPSSPAGQAAIINMQAKGAATGAVQENMARENVRKTAYGHKLDAIGMGKGLVANATTGLANASATASNLARNQSIQASETAQGVGGMVAGIGNALSKTDWSKVGGLFSSKPVQVNDFGGVPTMDYSTAQNTFTTGGN